MRKTEPNGKASFDDHLTRCMKCLAREYVGYCAYAVVADEETGAETCCEHLAVDEMVVDAGGVLGDGREKAGGVTLFGLKKRLSRTSWNKFGAL